MKKKEIDLTREPLVETILENLHLLLAKSASKPIIDTEITQLRAKPLLELYEEKQHLELFLKIYRSSTSKRGWRRNRYRQIYKKKLALLREAIDLSLWDVKFDNERNEQIALQKIILESET